MRPEGEGSSARELPKDQGGAKRKMGRPEGSVDGAKKSPSSRGVSRESSADAAASILGVGTDEARALETVFTDRSLRRDFILRLVTPVIVEPWAHARLGRASVAATLWAVVDLDFARTVAFDRGELFADAGARDHHARFVPSLGPADRDALSDRDCAGLAPGGSVLLRLDAVAVRAELRREPQAIAHPAAASDQRGRLALGAGQYLDGQRRRRRSLARGAPDRQSQREADPNDHGRTLPVPPEAFKPATACVARAHFLLGAACRRWRKMETFQGLAREPEEPACW